MATAQTAVKYVHTDALGSVVAMTDASGNVIEAHREYEPYGYQSSPALRDGPGYTGHVQDAHTGLTYMQQRYYDPLIGRFLSVDPVTALSDPVGYFGRYHYAANNPYKFTDPDGRAWGLASKVVKTIAKGGDIGATVAGAVEDARTLLSRDATFGQRVLAGGSLATEIFSPVSARDVKAGVNAVQGADRARDAQVIYRRGDSRETATRLEKKSNEAENSNIGIHGVSGSTTRPDGACSSATCGQLEAAGFRVHDTPTRADPGHKTIELPSPVSRDDAERFNRTFGRDK